MSDYIGRPDTVRDPARMLWANLPVMVCGSAVVAASWTLVRAGSPTLGWLTLIVIGVVVIPLQAAFAAGCMGLIENEPFTIRSFLLGLPRGILRSTMLTAIPLLCALLAVLAGYAWQQTGQLIFLGSLGAASAVSVVGLGLLVIALPYRLRMSAGWRECWLVAAYLSVRHPIGTLATLSAAGLAVWAAGYLSFAALLALPAPLALIWAASADRAVKHNPRLLRKRFSSHAVH